MKKRSYIFLFLIVIIISFFNCEYLYEKPVSTDNKTDDITTRSLPKSKSNWTFIFYYNADNNLEQYMLDDINEIKKTITNEAISVVVLIDRIKGYSINSDIFGQDFTDTRLYEIVENKAIRLDSMGYFDGITSTSSVELDLGDINNLKKLINYSKTNFPADKYALIIGSHGSGISEYDYGKYSSIVNYSVSFDDTNNSFIRIGEFTNILDKEQSIDLFIFDACLMGYVEIAYQFAPVNTDKFSCNYYLSAATEVVAKGFVYDKIFTRINTGENLSPTEIGSIFMEEQSAYLKEAKSKEQAYTLLDLSKIEGLKKEIDLVSSKLTDKHNLIKKVTGQNTSDSYVNDNLIHYFNENTYNGPNAYDWAYYSNFDLYSFFNVLKSDSNFSDLSNDINNILMKTEEMIITSFGSSDYSAFEPGKNGLSIFLPRGELYYYGTQNKYWNYQIWYNPLDLTSKTNGKYFGNLNWCKGNATQNNGVVENWFELLDRWFDTTDDAGGINYYSY